MTNYDAREIAFRLIDGDELFDIITSEDCI